MRVIAGHYRGRILKSPADSKTRPTSDRLRETLFNVLNPRIDEDTRFLDLCAGTGAIGIEAISRGAAFVTFVDISRRSCALIETNLDLLSIPEDVTEVICSSAEAFAAKEQKKGWDIAYYDPPYDADHSVVLNSFGVTNENILTDNGILIVEHRTGTTLPDAAGNIRRWRLLKQGDSSLSFYERN